MKTKTKRTIKAAGALRAKKRKHRPLINGHYKPAHERKGAFINVRATQGLCDALRASARAQGISAGVLVERAIIREIRAARAAATPLK